MSIRQMRVCGILRWSPIETRACMDFTDLRRYTEQVLSRPTIACERKGEIMRNFFMLVAGLVMGTAITTVIAQNANRGISHMNHVGILVPDIDAAVEYYTGTLGFTEAFRAVNDEGEPRLVYIQVSESSFIELNNGAGREPAIGHFGIHVEDMEAATTMQNDVGLAHCPCTPRSLRLSISMAIGFQ